MHMHSATTSVIRTCVTDTRGCLRKVGTPHTAACVSRRSQELLQLLHSSVGRVSYLLLCMATSAPNGLPTPLLWHWQLPRLAAVDGPQRRVYVYDVDAGRASAGGNWCLSQLLKPFLTLEHEYQTEVRHDMLSWRLQPTGQFSIDVDVIFRSMTLLAASW